MMCQFSCSGDGDKVPNQLGLRSVHKAQRAEHTVSHRGSTPSTNALCYVPYAQRGQTRRKIHKRCGPVWVPRCKGTQVGHHMKGISVRRGRRGAHTGKTCTTPGSTGKGRAAQLSQAA
jgi:hypothetical protein